MGTANQSPQSGYFGYFWLNTLHTSTFTVSILKSKWIPKQFIHIHTQFSIPKTPSVWKRYGIFPYRQPQYPVRDLSIFTIFRYGKNFIFHTANPLPSNTSSQKYGKYGKISTSLYKKKYIILHEYDNFLTYQRIYPIYT